MATCSPGRREGGTSGVALELARQLELRGHAVEILFQEDIPPSKFLPARLNELHFTAGVARHIFSKRDRYDVVYLRAPNGCVYGALRRLLFAKGAPPYVAELAALEERRVYAIRQETRKGAGWDNKWKNRAWHSVYHMPRFRWSIKTADAVACATREVWSYLQLAYGLPADRVVYLPHAVGGRFLREREYQTFRSPKLLFVGWWLLPRGTNYIIAAFTELCRKLPGTQLTIAGSIVGPEEILRQFPEAVRSSVSVVPLVPSEQMPDVYAAHDIFVFPSFFEALPLVLLEAMASGMPVVTAETCGMMDAVRNDWNGILVPPGDSQAIVDAVLRLCASRDLRERLGTNARETARWFSWERIGGILEGVLLKAVEEAKAGTAREPHSAAATEKQASPRVAPYKER